MVTKGLLLINLGTPDAPRLPEVRRYLREFLSDPLVIDTPALARWLLLNLVILPLRAQRSAGLYAKIWTERGSPLLVNGLDLASQVARLTQGEFAVELAMRYGEPSIEAGLAALHRQGVEELTVFPLFPQYAQSSTGTALERTLALLARDWPRVRSRVVQPFYADEGFLAACAEVARPALAQERADHVLFSFHGLPERHIKKLDSGAHCLLEASCCDRIFEGNRDCYRAQCYDTARRLAARLGLPAARYTVAFQSRLSRRWIGPFADEQLGALAERGVKRLAVMCPSFVADCLETLEEMGLRAKEKFIERGGRDLVLVPSLNAHPAWVRAAIQLARSATEV